VARAPDGWTNTATGTSEAMMARLMSRIAVSSPPGVSISMIRRAAPSVCAVLIARLI